MLINSIVLSIALAAFPASFQKQKPPSQSGGSKVSVQGREARRTRTLDEAFQSLADDRKLENNVKDILQSLQDSGGLFSKVPEWREFRDQLTKCLKLHLQIVQSGKEKNYETSPPIAFEGLIAANDLFVKAEQRRKEIDEEVLKLRDPAYSSKMSLDAINISTIAYLAINASAAGLYKTFLTELELLAINGGRAIRLEVHEAAAKEYPTAKAASKSSLMEAIENLMQTGYAQEYDLKNKARMRQLLGQLEIPLAPKKQKPEPKTTGDSERTKRPY